MPAEHSNSFPTSRNKYIPVFNNAVSIHTYTHTLHPPGFHACYIQMLTAVTYMIQAINHIQSECYCLIPHISLHQQTDRQAGNINNTVKIVSGIDILFKSNAFPRYVLMAYNQMFLRFGLRFLRGFITAVRLHSNIWIICEIRNNPK